MQIKPTGIWFVYYRNADGQLRRHEYFTIYHARQFATAMRHCPHITEVEIRHVKCAVAFEARLVQ